MQPDALTNARDALGSALMPMGATAVYQAAYNQYSEETALRIVIERKSKNPERIQCGAKDGQVYLLSCLVEKGVVTELEGDSISVLTPQNTQVTFTDMGTSAVTLIATVVALGSISNRHVKNRIRRGTLYRETMEKFDFSHHDKYLRGHPEATSSRACVHVAHAAAHGHREPEILEQVIRTRTHDLVNFLQSRRVKEAA